MLYEIRFFSENKNQKKPFLTTLNKFTAVRGEVTTVYIFKRFFAISFCAQNVLRLA
jgi:hypothetical protein